jgi:hypothetical protein
VAAADKAGAPGDDQRIVMLASSRQTLTAAAAKAAAARREAEAEAAVDAAAAAAAAEAEQEQEEQEELDREQWLRIRHASHAMPPLLLVRWSPCLRAVSRACFLGVAEIVLTCAVGCACRTSGNSRPLLSRKPISLRGAMCSANAHGLRSSGCRGGLCELYVAARESSVRKSRH